MITLSKGAINTMRLGCLAALMAGVCGTVSAMSTPELYKRVVVDITELCDFNSTLVLIGAQSDVLTHSEGKSLLEHIVDAYSDPSRSELLKKLFTDLLALGKGDDAFEDTLYGLLEYLEKSPEKNIGLITILKKSYPDLCAAEEDDIHPDQGPLDDESEKTEAFEYVQPDHKKVLNAVRFQDLILELRKKSYSEIPSSEFELNERDLSGKSLIQHAAEAWYHIRPIGMDEKRGWTWWSHYNLDYARRLERDFSNILDEMAKKYNQEHGYHDECDKQIVDLIDIFLASEDTYQPLIALLDKTQMFHGRYYSTKYARGLEKVKEAWLALATRAQLDKCIQDNTARLVHSKDYMGNTLLLRLAYEGLQDSDHQYTYLVNELHLDSRQRNDAGYTYKDIRDDRIIRTYGTGRCNLLFFDHPQEKWLALKKDVQTSELKALIKEFNKDLIEAQDKEKNTLLLRLAAKGLKKDDPLYTHLVNVLDLDPDHRNAKGQNFDDIRWLFVKKKWLSFDMSVTKKQLEDFIKEYSKLFGDVGSLVRLADRETGDTLLHILGAHGLTNKDERFNFEFLSSMHALSLPNNNGKTFYDIKMDQALEQWLACDMATTPAELEQIIDENKVYFEKTSKSYKDNLINGFIDDSDRNTLLHLLAYKGLTRKGDLFKALVDDPKVGADPNQPNAHGQTFDNIVATMGWLAHSKQAKLEQLLQYRSDTGVDVNAVDDGGNTILHRLAHKGLKREDKLFENLVDLLGVDPTKQNTKKQTFDDIVWRKITDGWLAQPITTTREQLEEYIDAHKASFARKGKDTDVNVKRYLVNAQDGNGNTLLHRWGNRGLKRKDQLFQDLIALGADTSIKNKNELRYDDIRKPRIIKKWLSCTRSVTPEQLNTFVVAHRDYFTHGTGREHPTVEEKNKKLVNVTDKGQNTLLHRLGAQGLKLDDPLGKALIGLGADPGSINGDNNAYNALYNEWSERQKRLSAHRVAELFFQVSHGDKQLSNAFHIIKEHPSLVNACNATGKPILYHVAQAYIEVSGMEEYWTDEAQKEKEDWLFSLQGFFEYLLLNGADPCFKPDRYRVKENQRYNPAYLDTPQSTGEEWPSVNELLANIAKDPDQDKAVPAVTGTDGSKDDAARFLQERLNAFTQNKKGPSQDRFEWLSNRFSWLEEEMPVSAVSASSLADDPKVDDVKDHGSDIAFEAEMRRLAAEREAENMNQGKTSWQNWTPIVKNFCYGSLAALAVRWYATRDTDDRLQARRKQQAAQAV